VAFQAVSKDPASLVREEIRALQAYHVSPAAGMVKLDAMENPYALPEGLMAQVAERLAHAAINRYPDPNAPALKQSLREAMGIPEGLDIILGNGSDELLQIISLALARPGAVALAPEPLVRDVPHERDRRGPALRGRALRADFSLDEAGDARARSSAHRPRSTGSRIPTIPAATSFRARRSCDRRCGARARGRRRGLLRVLGRAHAHARARPATEPRPRAHGLQARARGLRLGCAIGPRDGSSIREAAPALQRERALGGAAELLLAHRDVLDGQTRASSPDRARLESGLDALGVERFPLGGELHPGARGRRPRRLRAPQAACILVRTFHGSHALLANCLRLTVGTADENRQLVDALRDILS
jgi:histidinol-phosphate aminotransferase